MNSLSEIVNSKSIIRKSRKGDKMLITYRRDNRIFTRTVKLVDYNKAIQQKNEATNYANAMKRPINNYINEINNKKFNKYELNAISNKLMIDKYVFKMKLNNGSYRILTINEDTLDGVMKLINKRYIEVVDIVSGSDKFTESIYIGIDSIQISKMSKKNIKFKVNKAGKFFQYMNMSKLDLTCYQIVSPDMDDVKINNLVKEQCLLYVLKQYGVEDAKINAIKLSFKSYYIPKKSLNAICDIIGKSIILYTITVRKDRNRQEKERYGKKYNEILNIALAGDHYFKYEITGYNKYFIDHYDELKNIDNNCNIHTMTKGKYYEYSNTSRCNSLYLINKFLQNGLFKKHHIINRIVDTLKTKNDYIPLDNIQNEQVVFANNITTSKDLSIFYADCESVVSGEKHELLMMGVVYEKHDEPAIFTKRTIDDVSIITRFFQYIRKHTVKGSKAICYFHNLKYDFMGLLQPYLITETQCKKENVLYSVNVNYKGCKLELRDSYKLINIPLSKFSETFNLSVDKKEAIAYEFYNFNNINNISTGVLEYKSHLKTLKDMKQFMINLNENPILFSYTKSDQRFNATKYYKYYLKYDCIVLKEGLKVYEKIISKITSADNRESLNLHDSLTISSLANKYMKINNAFDGIHEVKFNLRKYISDAIYGGRVNPCVEFKKKIINKRLVDFDGVSLYPSAIRRLCNKEHDGIGIPTGEAKKIINFSMDLQYFICRIKITKINKRQQNPFIAIRTNEGINYVNEISEPVIVSIDKIGLEDYIKFHQIEYEFIDGVYWEGEFNFKFGDLIQSLFTSRANYKKLLKTSKDKCILGEASVMEQIIKLIMNSAYGKTLLKSSNVENAYVKNKDVDSYIYNNFNTIKEYNKINEYQTEITKLKLDDGSTMVHVGVIVLSYSKRIMNEVMSLASDNHINIYYQDTDSMHIEEKDINQLSKLYTYIYDRDLIGSNLGQFHSDFTLTGAKSEVISTRSIFLGKKSYIDCLEALNNEGKIITGYHIRLKGISESAIKYATEKDFNGDYYKLYEHLSSGADYEFVLNPYDHKVSFEYLKNNGIRTRETGEFKRIVSF